MGAVAAPNGGGRFSVLVKNPLELECWRKDRSRAAYQNDLGYLEAFTLLAERSSHGLLSSIF